MNKPPDTCDGVTMTYVRCMSRGAVQRRACMCSALMPCFLIERRSECLTWWLTTVRDVLLSIIWCYTTLHATETHQCVRQQHVLHGHCWSKPGTGTRTGQLVLDKQGTSSVMLVNMAHLKPNHFQEIYRAWYCCYP